MTALHRIQHAAKQTGWNTDLSFPSRSRGAFLHMTRDLDRLDVEFDTTERILWVGRYYDDTMRDSLHPQEYGKLPTLLRWMEPTL